MHQTKPYVQFSKKIVVAVCAAVTVITLAVLTMDWLMGQSQQATQVMKMYIQYAMVVFAAYSGNSMVQKWLVSRAKNQTYEQEQEAQG